MVVVVSTTLSKRWIPAWKLDNTKLNLRLQIALRLSKTRQCTRVVIHDWHARVVAVLWLM